MSPPPADALDRIAAGYAAKATTSELGFAIEQPATGFTWRYGATDRPHFIASITKLYTSAVIMQLRHAGEFTLDTRAAELLGRDVMLGLNVRDGHDHGPAITVRELLSNTSGIPDYFEQKRPDGGTLRADMMRADFTSTVDDGLAAARAMPSRFAPSEPGRAQYSDTNFLLLGKVIETVTAGSYDHAIRTRIIEPLGLTGTWLFTPDTRARFGEVAPMLHGRTALHVPNAMASAGPEGGVVSTPGDGLRFLRAFLGGELFPAAYLEEMTARWNSVFPPSPLSYGIGIMRFALPRWSSPLAPPPPMIGHSGASGSVLYCEPRRDLYICGTVNQFRNRSVPYRLMTRLLSRFE